MTIANDIINCKMPDIDGYLQAGESLDDIDEYGFTPLIETAITKQPEIAKKLLEKGAGINIADVTGRTPLHWAVDNNDLVMTKLFLERGANPNAYTRSGLGVLVYPLLRGHDSIKHLLYQYGAKLDFALDFIYAKLIGHRFELKGDVDIVDPNGEFIELDYEGFILEFTVAIIRDSLRRFTSSYSTKHFRHFFPALYMIIDALGVSEKLLQFQHQAQLSEGQLKHIEKLIQAPLLILPAASRGHALTFVKFDKWWAKIDRGENSLTEGSVNIYEITHPGHFNLEFIKAFLYQKQPREFFHQQINPFLGLKKVAQFPMTSQIAGNCSWANVQGIVPVSFLLIEAQNIPKFNTRQNEAKNLNNSWVEWDKDRSLDECIQRFYIGTEKQKASYVSMLARVLFQTCDHSKSGDIVRAEKILKILTLPEYAYVLKSYLDIYCIQRLTRRGNNLLKLLDDCGVNPNIGVTPIATGLKTREER